MKHLSIYFLMVWALLASQNANAASGGDDAPGALPPAPAAALPTPAPFDGGGFSSLPGAPIAIPSDPGTGVPGSAIPTPPPLSTLGLTATTDASTTTTTGAVAGASGPIETYEFLFRETEENGVLRERYTFDEAQRLRQQEVERLIVKYQAGGQPGAPPPQQGQQGGTDPRAGAEWDFYYEQLEMYSRYVKEKLMPNVAELPEPEYDAPNETQNRLDLKNQYVEAAQQTVSDQFNENREFYDRLESREDRRRDFYEWLAAQQQEVDEWTGLWARKVNGSRWADGEEIRRDDWYYGVDFNSAAPVTIEVDQQEYLLSRAPQNRVPKSQLNVISSNFSPYDIIDATGTMKNPEMERMRGTILTPPQVVEVTSRTVEIVP